MTHTFFWNGIYSNWYPSPFIINDITFSCEEQHMMYWKAITFEDFEMASKILELDSPHEMKEAGRKVKNFNYEHWMEVCQDIVYEGLKQKFLQNQELYYELCQCKGTQFVEASPYDRIWGIGYLESNALENKADWGMNILGNLLTKLANEICE